MLPDKYSVAFKEEEWTDMTYPIRVRIANLREKWAAHNNRGLPAPCDAVVCLDHLCYLAKCDWDATTTADILKNLTRAEIEIWCHRWQAMVNGKKPAADTIPANVTLYRGLEVWLKNACFLANLFAAAVYHKQIESLAFEGKVYQEIEGLATRDGLWAFEAWDSRLKGLETEIKGGTHILQASLKETKKPVSRTWMFEAQGTRLAEIQNKADTRNAATNASFSRSEQGLINRFAGRLHATGGVEHQATTNTASPLPPQIASVVPTAHSTVSEHTAAKERAGNTGLVDLTSSQEGDTTDDDDGFMILGSDPPADWHDSSSALAAAQSPVKSVATKRKRVEPEQDTIIESFQDNNGRTHHRGTTGRFVKGGGGRKVAVKTQVPKITKEPAIDLPQADEDGDDSGDEDGLSDQDEIAVSKPFSRLAGRERKRSTTREDDADVNERMVVQTRATTKAKESTEPAPKNYQKRMRADRTMALLAKARAQLDVMAAKGDAGSNGETANEADTSSSTGAKTAQARRSSATLVQTEANTLSSSTQASSNAVAADEESTSPMVDAAGV